MKRTILSCSLVLALGACSDDSSKPDAGADLSAIADLATVPAPDAATCTRAARADGPRFIAVSHPFSNDGDPSNDYELLALATDGTITRPNTHFTMGVATEGEIVFTPDGEVGYSTQNDGSIGIFAVSAAGAPTVIAAKFQAGPYAAQVVMGPMGDRLYIVDSDTSGANGGGIYEAPIECDGHLGTATLVTGADIPSALVRLAGGDYAFYARSLAGASAGQNVHRATLDPYMRTASVAASFALASPIVGASTATADGKYALFGDSNGLSAPDSISVVATSSGLAPVSMGEGDMGSTAILVNRPYALVASPYNNAVLVVSDYDNAFYKLSYDPTNTSAPFKYVGAITYKGTSPQLPTNAQLIDHGALADHVFVSELSGVRQAQFQTDGTITDLGLFDLGEDSASSVGILGLQP
jgi:hypothetical protein